MALVEPTRTNALVAFKARNVRSYRDETTLSLQATRVANADVVRVLQTASTTPERLLPVGGVFGANAAGKSTILRAMADMRAVVLGSFRGSSAGVYRRPFLLDPNAPSTSSEFVVDLILDGVWWQYGFEFDDQRILREFAFHYPHGRQALVFDRERQTLAFGPAFRALGGSLRALLRENALLLSIIGAAGDSAISPLFRWWRLNMILATSDNRPKRSVLTADLAKVATNRDRILRLLRAADLGLTDLKVVKPDAKTLDVLRRTVHELQGDEPSEDAVILDMFNINMVQLVHGDGDGVAFEQADESMGTQVWVGLVGPVLGALEHGHLLLVDEIDASLHPLLVNRLIKLFQSPDTNPRCAQLVFNAHDTTVLEDKQPLALGRDQIWFAERDDSGASRLVSLADFKARRDEPVRRRYLHGRYGGIPALDPAKFKHAVGEAGA